MTDLAGRVIYHVHALRGAVDAGFTALERVADHAADLGAGAILLTPVFASSDHGYDTIDPLSIDPRLGTTADFDRFVDRCHQRDLLVLLDGVFNHVGRDFPSFQRVLADKARSAWADWFRLDFDHDEGDGFAYDTFEGHRNLVALKHDNPEVLEWALEVLRHWSNRGVDGWRLDAAYAITRPFLRALATEAHRLDVLTFGEVIHGDYRSFIDATGLDSLTQYELHKAIWSSINDHNFFELRWALERHAAMTRRFTPVTFVGNHDVTRLATRLRDPRAAMTATAILMTLPGHPCVYYGDELGWEGRKEDRPGGDDAVRPPIPDPMIGHNAASELLDAHRRLIALRRQLPWLTNGSLDVVRVENQTITFRVTSSNGVLLTTAATDPTVQLQPPSGSIAFEGPGVVVTVDRADDATIVR